MVQRSLGIVITTERLNEFDAFHVERLLDGHWMFMFAVDSFDHAQALSTEGDRIVLLRTKKFVVEEGS